MFTPNGRNDAPGLIITSRWRSITTPYRTGVLRETIWVRSTAPTVELFHRGKRVAVHVRSSSNRKHTTVRQHMPSSHRCYADWTPERIKRQAGEIGPKTAALVEIILRERAHPEQGFRSCVGILRHDMAIDAELARQRSTASGIGCVSAAPWQCQQCKRQRQPP